MKRWVVLWEGPSGLSYYAARAPGHTCLALTEDVIAALQFDTQMQADEFLSGITANDPTAEKTLSTEMKIVEVEIGVC